MRLSDLEEEAYGPQDYKKIKAKQDKASKDKQKKSDRVKREREQSMTANEKAVFIRRADINETTRRTTK